MRMWDPFRDMEAIRREIDRALVGVLAEGDGNRGRVAFLPGRSARAYPLVNLSEDKDNFYVEALAPGVNPDSLDVSVVRSTLTVSGEKGAPADVSSEKFHRNERAAGKFIRSVELPTEVDGNRVSARYTDGLLNITLPKSESAKPRQIQVSVG